MKIILIYDIALDNKKDQKRLRRIKEISRRYLIHVQKSVFEGELTMSKLAKLESELKSVIDKERDSVIIYQLSDGTKLNRKMLTNIVDPLENII